MPCARRFARRANPTLLVHEHAGIELDLRSGVFFCLAAAEGTAGRTDGAVGGHGAGGAGAGALDFATGFSFGTRGGGFSFDFRRHPFAFLGAALALVGAFLAVHHVVLAAFLRAGAADFGAEAAEFHGELRVGAQEHGGGAANGGAIAIERDATGHRLDVLFLEAGARAIGAFVGAVVTGFDTVEIFLLCHNVSRLRFD